MFKSLFGLVGDVIQTAAAPVEMALDVTRVVTKPIANAVTSLTEEVKELIEDIIE